jgi:hypothetical protein
LICACGVSPAHCDLLLSQRCQVTFRLAKYHQAAWMHFRSSRRAHAGADSNHHVPAQCSAPNSQEMNEQQGQHMPGAASAHRARFGRFEDGQELANSQGQNRQKLGNVESNKLAHFYKSTWEKLESSRQHRKTHFDSHGGGRSGECMPRHRRVLSFFLSALTRAPRVRSHV